MEPEPNPARKRPPAGTERILVTGGGGYIGTHVIMQLAKAGCAIAVIDDFSNSFPEFLNAIGALNGHPIAIHDGDIRDEGLLDRVFSSFAPEAVIHLAGLKSVGDSVLRPAHYFDVNVGGSARLLKAMERGGCNRIVFSSTAAMYAETPGRANRETDPVEPKTPYALSKRMVEQMLEAWCACSPSRSATSLRYFNPIGADDSGLIGESPRSKAGNLMPAMLDVALGRVAWLEVFGDRYPTADGSGMRDFIHVADLARAHLAAIERDAAGHWIINIGAGRGVTVLQLLARFAEVTGIAVPYRKSPPRLGDIAVSVADPTLAKRELGWKAEYGLTEMCSSAWRWAKKTNDLGILR